MDAGVPWDAGVAVFSVAVNFAMPVDFASSARTDPGTCRPENQDAFLQRPELGLWVVADGMGGHANGALASRRVVDAFARMSERGSLKARVRAAQQSIQAANDLVYCESRGQGPQGIMGSTVAALLLTDDAFAALWAGDSRAYLYRQGCLRQLTRDHSMAERLIAEGRLTRAEARHHAASHRITRAVGVRPQVSIDMVRGHLEEEDRLVLCSDGLTNAVEDNELATIVSDSSPAEATEELMALALERGARDNVTVLTISVGATPRPGACAGQGF